MSGGTEFLRLELRQLEITPENLDVISVVNLQHQASGSIADEFVFQISHRHIIEPGLDMITFYAQAQRIPFTLLQNFLLLVGNLLEPATTVRLIDATSITPLGSHFTLPPMNGVEALDERVEEETTIAVALLLEL